MKKRKKEHKLYGVWKDARRYAGIVDEWSNFWVFAEWAENKHKAGYCLTRKDKDLVHGPENSVFVSRSKLSSDSDNNQNKFKKTCRERYGVDHPSQVKEFQDKKKQTFIDKYGVSSILLTDESKAKSLQSRINKGLITLYDGQTLAEIHNGLENTKSYRCVVDQKNRLGIDAVYKDNKYQSSLPNSTIEFLTEHGIEFETEVCIDNYRCDLLVEKKLAIELDGLYWHSDSKITDKQYHQKKQECYHKNGYQSLFIRENEIKEKFDIVQSIILNRLGKTENRVYGRKCEVVQPNKEEARQFQNNNHMMGQGSGQLLGLEYDGELVACIQYQNHIKRGFTYISRFCNKTNTNILGGLSKLMKRIPGPKRSFVDCRYGHGDSLIGLGFLPTSFYLSFKWTNYKQTWHRSKFPGNTGYEHGLAKIWDCGQKRFDSSD